MNKLAAGKKLLQCKITPNHSDAVNLLRDEGITFLNNYVTPLLNP